MNFKVIEHLFGLLFIVVLVDKLYILALCRISRRSPAKGIGSPEPDVVVQLPMYNEWLVYERIIDCACALEWPAEKLHIHVLDDSSDNELKRRIDELVRAKAAAGRRITVFRRPDRKGYKAGSLQHAMAHIGAARYVAIFDADFTPSADFLYRTIPILEADSSLAFVQARWTYLNPNQSVLTKLQKVALDFHHRGEQFGRSNVESFLNFNGSGGVWRVSAIEQCGGWSGETLVEDMDLSLRAFIRGLKGTYVYDLECPNELPDNDRVYRIQQRRWLAGPMHLLTLQITQVWKSRKLCVRRKIAAYWFFVRYAYSFLNAVYVLVVAPVCLAKGVSIYISLFFFIVSALVPFAINVRYWYIAPMYALGWDYSYFKFRATMEGLLRTDGARVWTVTQRNGTKMQSSGRITVNREEAAIAVLVGMVACYAGSHNNMWLAAYCGFVSLIYAMLAFGGPSKLKL